MAITIQFDDEELSRDYTDVATGGPTFETAIMGNPVGIHQRSIKRQDAIRTWDIQFGGLNNLQKLLLEQFFITKYGGGIAFKFFPPTDHSFYNDYVGAASGTSIDVFPLYRYYGSASRVVARRIVYPVLSSAAAGISVFGGVSGNLVNSATFLPGGFIRISYTAGNPTAGEAIFITGGEFDVPVVFMNDQLESSDYGPFSNVDSVRLVELLPYMITIVDDVYDGEATGSDTTPPTVPANFNIDFPIVPYAMNLQWEASSDDTAVVSYQIQYSTDPHYAGWVAYKTFPATEAFGDLEYGTIDGLTNDTNYWFRIRARDAQGNYSDWSMSTNGTPEIT
jgi:uncharacterized protein (TIGR02217 family)